MDIEYSKPLVDLPSFLSTISMVVDDDTAIIQQLIQAERKSPSIYGPTRDLFVSVLQGNFSFDVALKHASSTITDETERRCAIAVLRASERFLREEPNHPVRLLPRMEYILPNGMPLDVSPVWLRHFHSQRLMVLHFWQTPLSSWQLSAAATVLRASLFKAYPQYSSSELDFISVSLDSFADRRRFERLNWTKLKPLDDEQLTRFWKKFLRAWSDYQRRPPRVIRHHREPTLFDKLKRARSN